MGPRILLLDIETAPNVGYIWGKWEQNVLEFIDHWYILSYSYKWIGEKTEVVAISDYKNYKPGVTKDEIIVRDLWRLLDEADVVIAQNGDAFDIKKINTRFLQHKLTPPSPFKTIDTLKIARSKFAFNSNKLDEIGRDLYEGRKIQHRGFPLWLDCMAGKANAWKEMKAYNKQDVNLLYRIYKRFLPWISNHPNLSNYKAVSCCPKCGSIKLRKKGYSYNKTTKYPRFVCMDCGGWGRIRINVQETSPLVNI